MSGEELEEEYADPTGEADPPVEQWGVARMSPATAGSCSRSHCARESRAILQTSEEIQEGYGHLAMVFI